MFYILEIFILDEDISTLYFLLIFSKQNKFPFHSIFYIVDISVPTRQTKEFSAFSVSSALKHNPSASFVISCKWRMQVFGHF
jgi:hypothetical protein